MLSDYQINNSCSRIIKSFAWNNIPYARIIILSAQVINCAHGICSSKMKIMNVLNTIVLFCTNHSPSVIICCSPNSKGLPGSSVLINCSPKRPSVIMCCSPNRFAFRDATHYHTRAWQTLIHGEECYIVIVIQHNIYRTQLTRLKLE